MLKNNPETHFGVFWVFLSFEIVIASQSAFPGITAIGNLGGRQIRGRASIERVTGMV